MRETIEDIRLGLLRWNVAPLCVVGALCYFTNELIELLKSMTCNDETGGVIYGALTVLIAAMAGLLFKSYEYMQKNRGEK